MKTSMNAIQWLLLLLLSILWGGSFFFVAVALDDVSPFTLVTLRVALAAIALWLVVFIVGLRPPRDWRTWLAFSIMGLLNNIIPFTLIVWGQTYVPSSLAAILNAATPMFTVLVATVLLSDERANKLKILGSIIGFIGVAIMIGTPSLQEGGLFLAQIAILVAALSYAFAGVYGRRFKKMAINPIVTAAGQVSASALLLFPVTLSIEGIPDFLAMSHNTWLAIFGLAILSTAIAYILYFQLLAQVGATNLLLVTLLIPVSAILLGAIFLNENLATIHFVGMSLIAIGLSAIDGRLWQLISAKTTHPRYPK